MAEEIKKVWCSVNKVAFFACLLTSIFLLVVSVFLPPKGAIDPSVIAGTGELIGFGSLAAVMEGIDKAKKVTFQKGDTQITLGRNRHSEPEHGDETENELNGERYN